MASTNQTVATDLLLNADLFGWGTKGLSKISAGKGALWGQLPRNGNGDVFRSPNSMSRSNEVVMHGGIVAAGAMMASESFCNAYRPGSGVVRYTDTVYLSEFHHEDDNTVTFVQYNAAAKTISGVVVQGIETANRFVDGLPALNKSKKSDLKPIFMALIAYCKDFVATSLEDDMKAMKEQLEATSIQPGALVGPTEEYAALYRFGDTIYWGLKTGNIPIENIKADGSLPVLNFDEIMSGNYSGAEVVAGNPKYLINGGTGAARGKSRRKSGDTIEAVKNMPEIAAYVATRNNWSDEEREWIPSFPDDMPVPAEVVECAKVICKTATCKRPVLNFAWRGTSGFGKSTGVEMLACILQRPLLRLTCSSDTEKQQFLTEIMPDTTPRKAEMKFSFEEIACDPEGVYEQLTGKDVPGISCDQVLAEVIRNAAANLNSTPRYVMRESTYIRALKNGYICEVQESSRIRDPGVLPGLNEYDRPGALIPQVDGGFARRHPDAIVFYTDNVGYNSCNELDPSVLRRIAYIIDSTDLSKDQSMKRVMANTGVKDKTLVSSMYNVWKKVQDHCKDNDLLAAGGCVTIEELERWVQLTDIMGTDQVKDTCVRTLVSKATTDYDEQKTILSSVVLPALSAEHLM